jgi:hypothetical protein
MRKSSQAVELKIQHAAKTEEDLDKTEDTIKTDDTAKTNKDTAKIEAVEEILEDFYTRRHKNVKIPEEKRDYYLEVKFKNLKSSSHALDNLMEAVQASME